MKRLLRISPFIMTAMLLGLSLEPSLSHANGASTPEFDSSHITPLSTNAPTAPLSPFVESELSSLRQLINSTRADVRSIETSIAKYDAHMSSMEKDEVRRVKRATEQGLEANWLAKNSAEKRISYDIWVTILLACVAIIVTTLGVAVAVLTFIGYKATVRKAAELASEAASIIAKETAAEIARQEIAARIEDGSFNDLIEDAVDKVTFKGIGTFAGSDEDPGGDE